MKTFWLDGKLLTRDAAMHVWIAYGQSIGREESDLMAQWFSALNQEQGEPEREQLLDAGLEITYSRY